jgi:hypothetical protein
MMTPRERQQAESVWKLCQECARHFPNSSKAARLLFGTAAQESSFVHRRQKVFAKKRMYDLIGGFGLWQTEPGSITDSLKLLRRNRQRMQAALQFLAAYPISHAALVGGDLANICRVMTTPDGDALAVLFSRLHYLRVRKPIPDTEVEQASYWNEYYNINPVVGTDAEYLANWQRLCEPLFEERTMT